MSELKHSAKIPKGFVMVNLSIREQKALYDLARKSNCELRNALRFALFKLREDLKDDAEILRKTGQTKYQLGLSSCPALQRN